MTIRMSIRNVRQPMRCSVLVGWVALFEIKIRSKIPHSAQNKIEGKLASEKKVENTPLQVEKVEVFPRRKQVASFTAYEGIRMKRKEQEHENEFV